MIVRLLAAVSDNGVVALEDGSLPWQMRSDLKHFRTMTEGCALIVGRTTFDLLPRSMLDQGDRHFFVLSKSVWAQNFASRMSKEQQRAWAQFHLGQPGDGERYKLPNVDVVRSIEDVAQKAADMHRQNKLWCIGGPRTWNEVLPYASKVVLSRVHTWVDSGIEWDARPRLGINEMCELPNPFSRPGLEHAGFHLAMVEHRTREAGDEHNWSIEHWARGK